MSNCVYELDEKACSSIRRVLNEKGAQGTISLEMSCDGVLCKAHVEFDSWHAASMDDEECVSKESSYKAEVTVHLWVASAGRASAIVGSGRQDVVIEEGGFERLARDLMDTAVEAVADRLVKTSGFKAQIEERQISEATPIPRKKRPARSL